MTFRITQFASERGGWAVCALSSCIALGLLVRFSVGIELFSLAIASLMMAFLSGAYVMYRRWRPDPLLGHLSGALAVISLSGAAAGIISLVGLRLGAPLIDGNLAAIDRALGLDMPAFVRLVAASPFWSGLLGIAYDSSFPLLFAVVLVLALTKRFEQLWSLAFVFATTIVVCTTFSVFFPARGAFAFFGYSADVLNALPHGAGLYHLDKFDYYRHAQSPVISFSSLQGVVTFPSFHTCLALATITACTGIRWLFIPSLIWNALVIVSTVPVGGHYAIDLPAGAAAWLAATLISTAWSGRRNDLGYDALASVPALKTSRSA